MTAILEKAKGRLRNWIADSRLPGAAREEMQRDARGLPSAGPSQEDVIREGIGWLGRAQDCSASQDGGVARDYSLVRSWAPSYPETTGYIIPTLLEHARLTGDREARARARRMLDWLVAIQLPGGGFQGGVIGAEPVVPVTFNTGQILIGLAAGEAEFGTFSRAMTAAADWLVATQDADGCWRRHPSPFTHAGEKSYETHVAWGLLEAARVSGKAEYGKAGLANIVWALTAQRPNGWFEKCCLTDVEHPLTHTLGYVLRGVIEGYLYSGDAPLLAAARRTADGLLGAQESDGQLRGRLGADWRPAVDWVCVTGLSQIAHCWLLLHKITGERRYFEAGARANAFVRRTIRVDGPAEIRGAVKGSFPVDGDYGRFEYLNWACKFTIDANRLEVTLGNAIDGR